MFQFYFLSIVLNLIGAFYFIKEKGVKAKLSLVEEKCEKKDKAAPGVEKEVKADSEARNAAQNEFFALAFSLLEAKKIKIAFSFSLATVALIKLIFPVRGIFLLGDFFISLSSFAASVSLFLLSYENLRSLSHPFIRLIFYNKRRTVGFLCLAAAVLHFLFPASILL